jgi:hypothetical protein
MENVMVKDHSLIMMEENTLENLRMGNVMVKDHSRGLIVKGMWENSRME